MQTDEYGIEHGTSEDFVSDPELTEVLKHMSELKGQVSVYDLDFLLEKVNQKVALIKEYENKQTHENKVLSKIKAIAISVLKDLQREEYTGPYGTMKIKSILQIKMPQTAEEKKALFDWMREKEIYDRYATVNARSLKSLFEAELDIAKEKEDFDPITFALPGMQPATFFDDLKFTPNKNKKENDE